MPDLPRLGCSGNSPAAALSPAVAAVLSYSLPAVSQQLTALEKETGMHLLEEAVPAISASSNTHPVVHRIHWSACPFIADLRRPGHQ
jgi:hypothetical protein